MSLALRTDPRRLGSDWPIASPLQVSSLFSGIGGFELGLHAAGHETLLMCEYEPAAAAVLAERFPGVPVHDDVRTLRALPAETQLLVGGFPCTDLSQAGRTRGIEGDASGLVLEVFRLLEQQRVPWVLLENVPFMLQLAKGEALEVIISELERLGYDWCYRVVDSRAFGVPQRRRRVYMLASNVADPRRVLFPDNEPPPPKPAKVNWRDKACGFYWTEGVRGLGWGDDCVPTLKGGSTVGIPSSPAIVLPDGRVVKPGIEDAERMQGFPPGWTTPSLQVKRRGHRWKLVGNAVTTHAVQWIGERLLAPGAYDGTHDRPVDRRKRKSWPAAAWGMGGDRRVASVSEWPKREEREPLLQFLDLDATEPLSEKATAGFLNRVAKSSLRFPPGFTDVIRAHLASMRAGSGE